MDINQSYYFTNIYIIASVAALSGFLFGFDTGVIAGALVFINKTFTVTLLKQQLIVSSCILGAFFGALTSGKLADYYGRRFMLTQSALIFILGTLISVIAVNIEQIILGRFLLGIAIGISSYTAPLYVSELSPKSIRGKLITINILAITAGEVIAHYVNYIFIPYESWRLMFFVGLIPALMLFLFIILLPESPSFFIIKNQPGTAEKIIKDIASNNSLDIQTNSILNNTTISQETQNTKALSNLKELFNQKYLGILSIGILLGVMQQAVGINTIMYYGPLLFAEAGFKLIDNQILATMTLAIVNFIFTLFTMLLIDYLGRRKLLITGLLTASISLFISSSLLKIIPEQDAALLVFIALVFFVIGYAISLGAIFWIIISEIFPLHIRSQAMSLITAIQWLANFIVATTFLSLINSIGLDNTFLIYSILALSSAYCCYKHIPETKNIELEIIEKNLNNNIPIRYIGAS